MSEITPDYLNDLESERQFASQGNKARRVKIEKGHALLVRFLPFHMGPNKRPYARISNHWVNMKPHVCPRGTHPDWGGNPEAYCPICETADYLHDHAPNDDARNAAYKIKANPQWLMWCLVMAKDDGRSEIEYFEPPELWKPWEFQISKTSWDELSVMMRRTAARGGDILDVETGCNVWASRGKRGIRFDKDDNGATAIIRPEENYDEIIAKIWAGCKEPVVKIDDENKLALVAEKIQENFANGLYEGRGRDDRGGGRRRGFDDDDDRGGGGRRRGFDDDERDDRRRGRGDAEDDVPYDDPPPAPTRQYRAADSAPPPRRTAAPPPAASAPPPRRQAPPPVSDQDGGDDGGDQSPPPPPPPPRRPAAPPTRTTPPQRSAGPPARTGGTPPPPPARRGATPPPAPSRAAGATLNALPAAATASAEGAPTGEGSIDENEENIPEESRDPAPAAQEPLPPEGDAGQEQAATPPPPPPPPPRRSLDAALRSRIGALNNRGQ